MTSIPHGHVCGHHDPNPAVAETVADATRFWERYKPDLPRDRDIRRRLRLLVAFARREGATWQGIADSFECEPKVLRDYIGCVPRFGRKKPADERCRGVASGGRRKHLLEHDEACACTHRDEGCGPHGGDRNQGCGCRDAGCCRRHQQP